MKNILLGMFGIVTLMISIAAEAQQARRPLTCLWNERKNNTLYTKSVPCTDFDVTSTKSYKRVCLFLNSQWQFGALNYSSKSSDHTFVASRACDLGVYVTQSSESVAIASPRMADYQPRTENGVTIENPQAAVYRATNKRYTSTVVERPLSGSRTSLGPNDVPLSCYSGDVAGVPSSPMPCTRDPNSIGYCELRSATEMGTHHYAGLWWYRYEAPNRKSPRLCKGGLKYTDIAQMVAENGDGGEAPMIEETTVVGWDGPKGFLKELPQNLTLDQAPPGPILVRFATCHYNGTRGVVAKIPCANAATAGFVQWVNDEATYTARSNAQAERACTVKVKTKDVLCASRINTLTKTIFKATKAYRKALLPPINADTIDTYEKNETELDEVEDKLAKAKADLLDGINYFPIDSTGYLKNTCHVQVEFDKKTGIGLPTSAFIIGSNGTTRHPCVNIEMVKKRPVTPTTIAPQS